MKKIWALVLVLALVFAGCDTTPEIIPDITGDNVIMMDIKSKIEQGKDIKQDNSWLWWYAPILFVVVAWGVKEFFLKKEPDDCEEDEKKQETKEVVNDESKPQN
jgi:hypothetical protein